MTWIMDFIKTKVNPKGNGISGTYDGTPCRVSFYCLSYNVSVGAGESQTYVKWGWHQALVDSNELGNHSQSHETSTSTSESSWESEMKTCNGWLTKPYDPSEDPENPNSSKGAGATVHDIFGWRTPKLEYNDNTFVALKNLGFWYDCSIENGVDDDQQVGMTFLWPYTLDTGSPDNDIVKSHPGLWEMPAHVAIVPPELRAQVKKKAGPSFDETTGKITGLDYNMWGYASVDGLALNKDEFVATLKYTLDQRLKGNRAPFTFGAHADIYASGSELFPNATYKQRQQAIEEFINYALIKPEVRIVTVKKILDWCRKPVGLDGSSPIISQKTTAVISPVYFKMAGSKIIFDLQSAPESDLNIGIYDLKGRLLASRIVPFAVANHFEWNLNSVKLSGTCIVKISGVFASVGRVIYYYAACLYK
jgi:hypothetical protein